MQISVDTKHDSHEDIRRVIAMLQHLVGEKDVLTNAPASSPSEQQSTDMFANLFEDSPQSTQTPEQAAPEIIQPAEKKMEDLFSDLLSEDDLPEAKQQPEEEEEDETPLRKPKIEFY